MYFEKAWSKAFNNWDYFNTVLDLDDIRKRFNPDDRIVEQENLDPKSGMQRGLIDIDT